jgi:hypothetical protein
MTGGMSTWQNLEERNLTGSPPHPNPMASQARHESVSPQETNASRYVVPLGEGVSSSELVAVGSVSNNSATVKGYTLSSINA